MGSDGIMHSLTPDTGVSLADGMYIYDLCKKLKPQRTLEVGFAEGFSTMFFLAAQTTNGVGSHIAIDPFEVSGWHGLGLQKVKESGMNNQFRFMQALSIFALPALAAEGSHFEIIFIDGDHHFDGQLADFLLSDPLVTKGGYLLFHDTWMSSTKKLVSFIERNRPDYTHLPTEVNIGAFQKVGDDHRDWRHFVDF